MKITLQDMILRCQENRLAYYVMEIGGGARMLVLERGGRVFGPFYDGGSSLYWANPAWREAGTFVAFLKSMNWNIGGDRVWIAPEIQFSVTDRADFWGTLRTSPAVDPGSYALDATADACILRQGMTLEAHNLAEGSTSLFLSDRIYPAGNPLRNLTACARLMEGVSYSGYAQEITLEQRTGGDICAEAWNLTQVMPAGNILIPAVPNAEFVDYYEPVDAQHMERIPRGLKLRASGQRRYKVGVKAAHVFGEIAYLSAQEGVPFLYVKRFPNNPSAGYAEEPAHLPGVNGFSTHIYNDDGKGGGFSEMECNLQTVGGKTNRHASQDTVCNWFYRGEEEKLKHILAELTGIAL